jgi:hypothetical protein
MEPDNAHKLNHRITPPAQIKGLGKILADKTAEKFAPEIQSISAWK